MLKLVFSRNKTILIAGYYMFLRVEKSIVLIKTKMILFKEHVVIRFCLSSLLNFGLIVYPKSL